MNNTLPGTSNHEELSSKFCSSLKELREMHRHLHSAADHYMSTFCISQDKKQVVKSSKEYLCRATVSIVDHLGSISSQLNSIISATNDFSIEELRINTMKQRLHCCEYYAHTRCLPRLEWDANVSPLNKCYLSKRPGFVEPSDASFRPFCSLKSDENLTIGKVSSIFHFKNEGDSKKRIKITKRRDIKALMMWKKNG